jgi:hypothetical protein
MPALWSSLSLSSAYMVIQFPYSSFRLFPSAFECGSCQCPAAGWPMASLPGCWPTECDQSVPGDCARTNAAENCAKGKCGGMWVNVPQFPHSLLIRSFAANPIGQSVGHSTPIPAQLLRQQHPLRADAFASARATKFIHANSAEHSSPGQSSRSMSSQFFT